MASFTVLQSILTDMAAGKYIFTPFDVEDIVFNEEIIPPDLRDLVAKAKLIERKKHPDYPSGIWWDNVQVHTIRSALTAEYLKLPRQFESSRPDLVRTLWIHDLPEVLSSMPNGYDTSAVVKEDDPKLARIIEADEEAVAKKIFSDTDLRLFQSFEQARHTLEGDTQPSKSTNPISYLARLIDAGEGELCFYFYLTQWLASPSFDGRMPTERPYLFTANRYEKFSLNVSKLHGHVDDELVDTCLHLIKRQVLYILTVWKTVESQNPKHYPSYAKVQTERMSKLLPI
jgi:hypothetical protein